MEAITLTETFFTEEIKKGNFFLEEKLITSLPSDWIDFCMACHQLMSQQQDAYVIILDDDETKKMFDIIESGETTIYALDNAKRFMWNFKAIRNDDGNVFFFGGENLRKFCDKENIFYESDITDTGLISFTGLKYLKHKDEDCRIPLTEEEKKRRRKEHKEKK